MCHRLRHSLQNCKLSLVVLQVTPESLDEVIAGMMQGVDPSTVPADQMERMMAFAQRRMDQKQQVPMMRVMTHQSLPVVRVAPFNEYQRNRFYRPNR